MPRREPVPATAGGIPVHCAFDAIQPIGALVPNPKNPNHHPEGQIQALADIIVAQGWRSPITVSKRSGFVVRGHGRLLAAQRLGATEVPVDLQEYESEAAEYADLIADNRIAELAQVDFPLLTEMLAEMDTGDIDMTLTGYSEADLEKLMTWTPDGEVQQPEYEFVTELMEAHNYIVLYFDNELDWQSAQTKLGIKPVQIPLSKGSSAKTVRVGKGRVVRGAPVIRALPDKVDMA